MRAPFNTLAGSSRTITARALMAAGMTREAAVPVAAAIRAGYGEQATRTDLAELEDRMARALYRALCLQAAGIVGTLAVMAVAAAWLIGSAGP